MDIVRIILTVVLVILSAALIVLILSQEGKSSGLAASLAGGSSDTYWGKNKSRSMEGNLVKITRYLAIGFIVIAVILNLNF